MRYAWLRCILVVADGINQLMPLGVKGGDALGVRLPSDVVVADALVLIYLHSRLVMRAGEQRGALAPVQVGVEGGVRPFGIAGRTKARSAVGEVYSMEYASRFCPQSSLLGMRPPKPCAETARNP